MALAGLKVIEFAGLAPGPFAGLVLADNGAKVVRVDRPNSSSSDVLNRGKRSIAVDSKVPAGRELLKKMIASADVVIDPFRPGVMERMGLGPEVFLGDGHKAGLNERLVYARIVGFPRTGSHKDMAGHDINYAALSGVLSMLPGTKPTFPLNLLADFAGGGMMCALGILLALIERGASGKGQVVNTDMVAGSRYVSSFPLIHTLIPNSPMAGGPRGTNPLDGGAPFYNLYACKDGGWMSVGCLEPQFFKAFLELFLKSIPQDLIGPGCWKPTLATQGNRAEWSKLADFLEKGFLTNTREYWTNVYHETEACTVPVLTPAEAGKASKSLIPEAHPLVRSQIPGGPHQTPLPTMRPGILLPGQDTDNILREYGLGEDERRSLSETAALGKPSTKAKL
ncbi:alpha-methylacyl-CoA racemase [Ephemerocybe angulata]|uniref:Alpha-methylacyl-CoA racemase n=1 Tax=Ephemerocybe angulata TaxID=980116 RepID=A0A8H6I3I9_9AGAR|nr:alpha-methylacyl-CoA racemase [Tulosesus angulatus]